MSANRFPASNSNGYSGNGSSNGRYGEGAGRKSYEEYPSPDEIDLKRLFFTLWQHKWVITATVVICAVLAGAYAWSVTPIYRSEGTILIKDSPNKLSMAGDEGLAGLLSSSYGIGMGSTIANELQILRSRNLSLEMADSMLKRRVMSNGEQFPVLYAGYPEDDRVVAGDTVASRLRERFTFSRADREADLVTITYESPSPREAAFAVNLAMAVYSELSTRQNRQAANAAVDFLEEERSRIEERLTDVEQRLRAFMNREQLVQIDAQTQKLIEQMAELESRRQEARVRLVAVNSALQQYRERLNTIKPGLAGQYADAVGPNMSRLQYQLAELQIEKMQLQANNPELKQQGATNGKLAELNEKITFYRDRIEELTGNLINRSDEYVGFLGNADGNVAETITELNRKMIELKVEQQQYNSQVKVLDAQLAEQRKFFEGLPDNMIELARLKRDVTINEELFLTVSKQFAEMSLWEQTQFGLGRPVDDGYVPETPVKPNKKLYVLVGLLIGGVLSVGFVFTRESFNTSIDGVEKIMRFEPPLLAVIPTLKDFIEEKYKGKEQTSVNGRPIATSMVSLLDSVSPASESFRRLQSNIIYNNPDVELKSIMITSATQGEGKTTIASNLAVVLAEAGFRVAAVDTDLRRPQMHRQFAIDRSPGVFECCFDNTGLDEALKPTVMENLKVLPAGQEPPNPSALTQSSAFLNLIADLENRFDYVILDTPPYGIITDASALIKQTDGVVVVARFNQTTEAEMDNLLINLERINAHVLGSVLTDFDFTRTSDYHYNSYYFKEIYKDYESYQKK